MPSFHAAQLKRGTSCSLAVSMLRALPLPWLSCLMGIERPLKQLHEGVNLAQQLGMAALCDCLVLHTLQGRPGGSTLQHGGLLSRPVRELLGMLCFFRLPAHAVHPVMPTHGLPQKVFLCGIRITRLSQLCRPGFFPAGHNGLCTRPIHVTNRTRAAA